MFVLNRFGKNLKILRWKKNKMKNYELGWIAGKYSSKLEVWGVKYRMHVKSVKFFSQYWKQKCCTGFSDFCKIKTIIIKEMQLQIVVYQYTFLRLHRSYFWVVFTSRNGCAASIKVQDWKKRSPKWLKCNRSKNKKNSHKMFGGLKPIADHLGKGIYWCSPLW